MKFHLNRNQANQPFLTTSPSTDQLPVKGQGTVWVSPILVEKTLVITLASEDQKKSCNINIGNQDFKITEVKDGETTELYQSSDSSLLIPSDQTNQSYWVSLDSNNRRIRYGKGEPLPSLMLMELTWAETDDFEQIGPNLQNFSVEGTPAPKITILRNPVNLTPPPTVISEDQITLEVIADNTASVVSDLPEACQTLYGHVAHQGINLTPEDFPEFAQAIQYSINKPGCLCYEKLKEKDPIFGYLRITLDPNLGDSPGQPYVLEIWPAGNGSPIHNHGEACAVIKVLYGQIKISWFSTLSPAVLDPWGSIIAHEGDVTFLTPNYYQIHQLFNPSPKAFGGFCATIQCYQYPFDDLTHYEYFDYLEDGKIKHFLPDSDWGYLEFKQAIHEEWTKAMKP